MKEEDYTTRQESTSFDEENKKVPLILTQVHSTENSVTHGPKFIHWIYKLDALGFESTGIERVSQKKETDLQNQDQHGTCLLKLLVFGGQLVVVLLPCPLISFQHYYLV